MENTKHVNDEQPKRRLLKIDAAAFYLSVSTWCLYRMVSNMKIMCVRIGVGKRSIRFDVQELDRYIRKNSILAREEISIENLENIAQKANTEKSVNKKTNINGMI